jgi:hypothetical protein
MHCNLQQHCAPVLKTNYFASLFIVPTRPLSRPPARPLVGPFASILVQISFQLARSLSSLCACQRPNQNALAASFSHSLSRQLFRSGYIASKHTLNESEINLSARH